MTCYIDPFLSAFQSTEMHVPPVFQASAQEVFIQPALLAEILLTKGIPAAADEVRQQQDPEHVPKANRCDNLWKTHIVAYMCACIYTCVYITIIYIANTFTYVTIYTSIHDYTYIYIYLHT